MEQLLEIRPTLNDTDRTFFTNEKGHTLLDRFKVLLKDVQYFDVLVGYFRSSGFYLLQDAVEPIDKVRILVGLSVDSESYKTIDAYRQQTVIDFESHYTAKKEFQKNLIEEVDESGEADQQVEAGLRKFIAFLQADCPNPENDRKNRGNGKKLEIKAYPARNIHAKVYVGRFSPDDRDYGFVVTGSSNFSYSGLVGNREFNVELRKPVDVRFALNQFEELWQEAVDMSANFVETVTKKTWLNDSITPYELYLKLIYEYLQEDINLQDTYESFLPDGFMRLQYQEQAVIQALKKLEEYNGVFIADVVGLGKTFIAAQLLQQVRGRILVICPPVLKNYWDESLREFYVPARVESLGKLDHIIRAGVHKYDYVVVDEAHRFRNDGTQAYADLLDICRGKKVILLTATPLNNSINDIFAQLKLFQAPRNSTIPGVPNLEKFFLRLRKQLDEFEKSDPAYKLAIKSVSNEIREKVLKLVMVRRTRKDVLTYFKSDVLNQGLAFPVVHDPQKIVYEYRGETEQVFKETIRLLTSFRYARYITLLYYVGNKGLTEFEKQQQRNVGGFMKGVLVKRLESSFHAFRQSIDRFVKSYERFIAMLEKGTVYISKKTNVFDLLDSDDMGRLEELVEAEAVQKYDANDFRSDFLTDLTHDLALLKQIQLLWKPVVDDPKLRQFIHDLKTNPVLKKQKIVVFTESKETGDYLYDQLLDQFPGQLMFYSSAGGRHTSQTLLSKHTVARDLIRENYDPNSKEQANDLRILLTTDVLAEGINLHRSNVLINYDLPWNPTRVLQRAGRVNRLGSKHPDVFIYNFFPTTQSDEHLGLEENITNKLQLFHDILGEDAKYLSDGEEIGSQELFDKLNNKKAYTGEEEEGDSELKYLELMRTIRDKQPDLFEKIKNLPKKTRSGFQTGTIDSNQLVTFFRIGKLKKFYRNQDGQAAEITFFDAVRMLECPAATPRSPMSPDHYFHLLETNKARFELDGAQTDDQANASGGGRSNLKYVEDRLKARDFKNFKGFTDSDEEFIRSVKQLMAQGDIAKKTAQVLKKELETEDNPLRVLIILRKHIRSLAVGNAAANPTGQSQKKEVILSGYLIPTTLPPAQP